MRRTDLTRLAGKRVLVTGAAGAFGGATMQVLAQLGARAVGLDRKPDDRSTVLACDVTDPAQVTEAVGAAVERLGGLDVLIHYAGIGPAADAGAMPDRAVRETVEVNLMGTWRVTAAAIDALVASRGRVVITASLLAGLTVPFAGAYTVSKRALTAYADTLRAEYGTHIGVSTVYPGYVDTPIHDRSRAAGVSLDGLVPAERRRDTVLTALGAAAAPRAPRDTAATPLGTAALRLTRHFPALVEKVAAVEIADLVRTGELSGGEIARGLHERHGASLPSADRPPARPDRGRLPHPEGESR